MRNIKSVKTQVSEYLLTVNPNTTNLDAEKAYVFHTKIDKSLFIWKMARPNIQPMVQFLCTRVKRPYEDNWKLY